MANNLHKKMYSEDKFARKHYCDNSRLRQVRSDKKQSEKAIRQTLKKTTAEAEQ